MSDEAQNSASERVATQFSRVMNASTSPYGVLADLTASAAFSAVPFVLFVRQMLAGESRSPLTAIIGVLAFAPWISTALIGVILRNARAGVVAWLAAKPFPVDNLNALLNGLGDSFDVTFAAGVEIPTRDEMQPLLDVISDDTLFFSRKEEQSKIEIKTGVIDSKRLPLRTSYQRYVRFHRIVDEVLVPLHARLPIANIRIQ